MNKLIQALFVALLPTSLCIAQDCKPIFDDNSAKAFFVSSPNLATQANEYIKSAREDYAKNDFENASKKMYIAKFFDALIKSESSATENLKVEILSNADFLKNLISEISPKDDIKKVFEILSNIQKSSPEKFSKYRNLAGAIAIVFDTTPPDNWPHSQVSKELLPRTLPEPTDAFKKIVDTRERGKFLLPPEKLSIEELKYLVASPTTDEDKQWAQQSISVNLANIAKLYPSIKYDFQRLNAKKFDWEGSDYRLKTIKSVGGICTDQSYFTSEVAKAKGVPAFVFSGAGSDGFHAWVAYMQKSGSWNFNVGRYENARFVTGTTIDPQTWEIATDHQLNAMREGFRNGAKYALSEIHSMFAKYFYDNKEFKYAEDSAKKSIVADQRNTSAWEILIASLEKQERPKQEIIKMYESAIKAFSKYPDIDAQFRRKCIDLLIDNGKEDIARRMSTSIIVKTKANRPDIAMEFARRELQLEIKNGTQDKIVSSYKRLIAPFKSDPAMTINGIVIPIINSLLNTDKYAYANDIIKATKQIIKSKDATIKTNLDNIEAQVQKIISKKN